MRREQLLLEDILSAADAIAEFVRGQQLESFEANRMVRSAVVHQLTIVGEAVAHLPQEIKTRYPTIPWSDIKGLRNIVVHNFSESTGWRSGERPWKTSQLSAPRLRKSAGPNSPIPQAGDNGPGVVDVAPSG
ncbi:MAG: DUF86 domain-containing protein [Bryobacteraceae bacterium]